LQVPSQVATEPPQTGRPLTGAVPLAVSVHEPGFASQREHWPLHCVPQQKLSTQKVDVHEGPLLVQERPLGSVVKQAFVLQKKPLWQLLSLPPHALKQPLPEQMNGLQAVVVCVLQAPDPLHTAELSCVELFMHD
jgi:hypothetical protein